ncbi:defensin-A-like [Ochlerotatus camptorhynchus]|uniref:defensin-A-like n=1 Tax=Ochlerotatus camptorhynchus TaxID=644619 RepID=UPI0031E4675D
MQSLSVICSVAICVVALATTGGQAYPQGLQLADEQVRSYANTLFDELPEESYQAAGANLRLKRATCDLLSGFGVQDSACAAHCIARGNRGGYCSSKKVCICRK